MMIHPTADVSKDAEIGKNSKIWHQAQVREKAIIGDDCVLSKNVYVCAGVKIGNNVKIQNNVSIYQGVKIEDGVFVGPHVCFTNDKLPRSISPDGNLKTGATAKDKDWELSETLVKHGASLGANSTIVSGITIGCFALVGAGSVVTKSVPDYGLVYGNPARLRGFVCVCAGRMILKEKKEEQVFMICDSCGKEYFIDKNIFESVKG